MSAYKYINCLIAPCRHIRSLIARGTGCTAKWINTVYTQVQAAGMRGKHCYNAVFSRKLLRLVTAKTSSNLLRGNRCFIGAPIKKIQRASQTANNISSAGPKCSLCKDEQKRTKKTERSTRQEKIGKKPMRNQI